MLVPLATMWVPTAIGLAVASGIVAVVIWRQSRGPGSDGTEDPGSDGGGGWWRRRRPRRPPPVGPVVWDEFERQFATYVNDRRAGGPDRSDPARRPERIGSAGGHPRRGA